MRFCCFVGAHLSRPGASSRRRRWSFSGAMSAFLMLVAAVAARANDETFDADGNWIGDIQTSARHCGEVVGAPIPSFSCEADGVAIPITIKGRPSPAAAPDRCDRPAFNVSGEEACRVGSRLGRLKFDDPDIEGVFICRRSAHPGPNGRLYEEIAVLQHNQRNGATCGAIAFGGDNKSPPLSGDVRSPVESASANADGAGDWLSPNQIVCATCHKPDPFLFTPYVEQVRQSNGQRVMPGFYDGPDGLNPRLWYPLSPVSDQLLLHRVEFPEGSPARICTSCHALGASPQSGTVGSTPLIAESLGLGGEFLDAEGRQVRRAVNPGHSWMHIGHPVIRPPFALMPNEFPGFAGFGFLNELGDCLYRGSNDCTRRPFRGRPPKAMEFSPSFALTHVAPGVEHLVSARQRNHDPGDLIRLKLRDANGQTRTLKNAATFDEPVAFSVDCEPGEVFTLRSEMVRDDGSAVVSGGRAVSAERSMTCMAPRLTRWLPETKTLEAMPDMTISGGLVGPVATFPVSGLSVGDRNNNEAIRAFLTFPIKPPVGRVAPKRAVLRLSFEQGNGDTRPLGALQIHHYRYGSALNGSDFSSSSAPREGLARIPRAAGVWAVDVTRHVRAAWDGGDDRLQLGLWFSQLSDRDRSFDVAHVSNRPVGDGAGYANFDRFVQPLLTVTFE